MIHSKSATSIADPPFRLEHSKPRTNPLRIMNGAVPYRKQSWRVILLKKDAKNETKRKFKENIYVWKQFRISRNEDLATCDGLPRQL